MNAMRTYYVRMSVVSLVMGAMILVLGGTWWQAALVTFLALLFVWWAARSGRYRINTEKGILSIQRDERAQTTSDKAARNAWVIIMLAMAGIVLYYNNASASGVPIQALNLLLLLGWVVYFASDLWMQRT